MFSMLSVVQTMLSAKKPARYTTGLVVQCGLGSVAWHYKCAVIKPLSLIHQRKQSILVQEKLPKKFHFCIALLFNLALSQRVEVCTDNTGTVSLIHSPLSADRAKYVHVIYHHVSERLQCGQLSFMQVQSKDNVADIFTKPLGYEVFYKFRMALGVLV